MKLKKYKLMCKIVNDIYQEPNTFLLCCYVGQMFHVFNRPGVAGAVLQTAS